MPFLFFNCSTFYDVLSCAKVHDFFRGMEYDQFFRCSSSWSTFLSWNNIRDNPQKFIKRKKANIFWFNNSRIIKFQLKYASSIKWCSPLIYIISVSIPYEWRKTCSSILQWVGLCYFPIAVDPWFFSGSTHFSQEKSLIVPWTISISYQNLNCSRSYWYGYSISDQHQVKFEKRSYLKSR